MPLFRPDRTRSFNVDMHVDCRNSGDLENHESIKNFLGRALLGGVLTVVWVPLAVATWGFGQTNLAFLSDVVGFVNRWAGWDRPP